MSTPNYIVGKAVAVSLGGVLGYAKGGNITRQVEAVKMTNAKSGGFREVKAGIKSADAEFDYVFNADVPPAIFEGTEVTMIFDALGYETAEAIANPSTTPTGLLLTGQFLIVSMKDTWQAEGDYGYSVTAQSTGAYTAVYTGTGSTPTT